MSGDKDIEDSLKENDKDSAAYYAKRSAETLIELVNEYSSAVWDVCNLRHSTLKDNLERTSLATEQIQQEILGIETQQMKTTELIGELESRVQQIRRENEERKAIQAPELEKEKKAIKNELREKAKGMKISYMADMDALKNDSREKKNERTTNYAIEIQQLHIDLTKKMSETEKKYNGENESSKQELEGLQKTLDETNACKTELTKHLEDRMKEYPICQKMQEEIETRIKETEDRLKQYTAASQSIIKDVESLLEKVKKLEQDAYVPKTAIVAENIRPVQEDAAPTYDLQGSSIDSIAASVAAENYDPTTTDDTTDDCSTAEETGADTQYDHLTPTKQESAMLEGKGYVTPEQLRSTTPADPLLKDEEWKIRVALEEGIIDIKRELNKDELDELNFVLEYGNLDMLPPPAKNK